MKKTLQNLFKVTFRRTIPLQFTTPTTFSRSKHKSTLGRSYVLMEDGVQITELPWIVKRLENDEVPLSYEQTNESSLSKLIDDYNSQKVSSQTANNEYPDLSKIKVDKVFLRMLQECDGANQVMKLLEIPGNVLSSQAAAIILILLYSSNQNDLNTLLQPLVFQEICTSILQGVTSLPNNLIISLTSCCLSSKLFSEEFIEALEAELEGRLPLSFFTINQLCSLITIYSESTHANPDLIKVLWIHLGNRFRDINEDNISNVFKVLRNLPPGSKYLIYVADKQLQFCCAKLQADDIAGISEDLCLLNHYSSNTSSLIGRWLYANVHKLNTAQMTKVLGLFNHFNFADSNFMKALEKFVVAFAKRTVRGGNTNVPRTLLAMTADMCNGRRYVCPPILEALATDFTHSASLKYYELRDGLSVLKVFGQLAYLPSNSSAFFHAAEKWLEHHSDHASVPDLLELLASFIYIERYPINFVNKIFNPYTIAVLQGIDDLTQRIKASKHLLEIQASQMLESPYHSYVNIVDDIILNLSLNWLSGREYRFHREVAFLMRSLIGLENFRQLWLLRHTPHLINFSFTVDEDKNFLRRELKIYDAARYAVLLVMPEKVSLTGTLMGELVLKKRHIEKYNYTVILIHYEEMMWKCKNRDSRLNLLRSTLQPFINLPPPR